MSKKLLLADDSVVIQKLVGLSFANEDVEIVSTDNGDDAVTLAQEIQPDVVLADVVMPGKSGYEVCEAIKQDPTIGQTPVLLLTGTFEAFDEGRAASAGADGQITKPFEAQALVERVTEVMNAPRPAPQQAATPATAPPATASTELPPAAQPAAAAPPPVSEPRLDAAETVVSSIPGSTSDLFDSDISTLSPPPLPGAEDEGEDDALGLDGTPDFLDEAGRDASASTLFGAPGDGASDLLDDSGGDLAIGQSVAPTSPEPAAEDATIAMVPESDPLSASGPVGADLGTALDAAPSDSSRGLAIGTDDINASTSPSFEATPEDDANALSARSAARVMGGGPADSSGNLTVHVPSADIDADRSAAPTPPAVEPPPAAPEQPTVVADLDAALSSPSDGTSRDPLSIATERPAEDDLDFAFDVSEQAAVRDETDPLADSFSSLMDISEASILGHSAPNLNDRDEALGVGYDVSSSDLATAEPEPDRDEVSSGPPVPEPEPLLDVPELPEARMADRAEDLIVGAPGSFRGASGDPTVGASMSDSLPEVEAEHTFTSPRPASEPVIEEPIAATSDPGVGIGAPSSEPTILSLEPPSAPEPQSAPEPPSTPMAQAGSEQTDEPAVEPFPGAGDESPVIELPEDTLGPQSGIGRELLSAREPETSERRIADLSPLVEQRIQESLEKVAWEAFSDLSETIVKQVLDRVEQVAWEVIPQMAETLVREEIRKMKGEDD